MPGPGHWQRKFRSPEFPISRGSFSSVSTLLIARVGAFFSIFQDLQDCYTFAPLQCKILRDFASLDSLVFRNEQIFGQASGKLGQNLGQNFGGGRQKLGQHFGHGQFYNRETRFAETMSEMLYEILPSYAEVMPGIMSEILQRFAEIFHHKSSRSRSSKSFWGQNFGQRLAQSLGQNSDNISDKNSDHIWDK